MNVGGTGKLPMSELKAMCKALGFENVRTYIASGNVVFVSRKSEAAVKKALEARLEAYAGKAVGVMVRTAAEMQAVLKDNPFPKAAGRSRSSSTRRRPPIRLPPSRAAIGLVAREIYVHYGEGMGQSKPVISTAKAGTERNMNTIAALAKMPADL